MLKIENNKPWFKPLFNTLLHSATVSSHCLEYLGYITLCTMYISLLMQDWVFRLGDYEIYDFCVGVRPWKPVDISAEVVSK